MATSRNFHLTSTYSIVSSQWTRILESDWLQLIRFMKLSCKLRKMKTFQLWEMPCSIFCKKSQMRSLLLSLIIWTHWSPTFWIGRLLKLFRKMPLVLWASLVIRSKNVFCPCWPLVNLQMKLKDYLLCQQQRAPRQLNLERPRSRTPQLSSWKKRISSGSSICLCLITPRSNYTPNYWRRSLSSKQTSPRRSLYGVTLSAF